MQDLKLLKLMEEHVKKELDWFKKEGKVVSPLKKDELEANTILRLLYNQAYYCTHAGLGYASVLLQQVLLERLTRDTYKLIITNPKKENEIDWGGVLKELSEELRKRKLKDELLAVLWVKWIKNECKRNKYHHADVEALLKDLRAPAVKLDMITGYMTREDFLIGKVKELQPEMLERVTKTRAEYFFPYTSECVKILNAFNKKLKCLG